MNSQLELLLVLLEESGKICGIDTSQDRKTILARFEAEGEQFLTITLPSMTKDLYQALDQRKVTSNLFPSFKRLKEEKLPVFLGGFFRCVFDRFTGGLLCIEPTPEQVQAVRSLCQITGFMGKLFEVPSPKRTSAALYRYVENDARVGVHYDQLLDYEIEKLGLTDRSIRLAMHVLFGDSFRLAEYAIKNEMFLPGHGPGSVADKLFGNEKWQQPAWPQELEDHFPFGRWRYNSWLNFLDDVDAGRVADPGDAIPVKVIAVPKTQKTPRIIAVEPTCMQYMQQGFRRVIEESLRGDSFAEAMVGYSSQEPNQLLARQGSITGDLATLDLSDASDLVSFDLVCDAFHDWPHLCEALTATRSKQARVEGFESLIRLRKFASMGSALCFPVEAMMFASMALLGCHLVLNPHGTLRQTKDLLWGKVRVYGDDIIVPANCAQSVTQVLEAYGLKVNRTKSFWNGNFRESCGKEYWYGHDITYVKLRYRLPSLQKALSRDVPETVHTVALRNNLFKYGLFDTVAWLDSLLYDRLDGVYPVVAETSSALGRHDPFDFQIDRIDNNLQKPLVKAYVVSVEPPASPLDGYGALLKCLVDSPDMPNPDSKHLLRAGRPSSLRIKKRWVSPV